MVDSTNNGDDEDEEEQNENEFKGVAFNGQDEYTAKSQYNMHDIGEAILTDHLDDLQLSHSDECGFDSRKDTDEDEWWNIDSSEYSDKADLKLTGLQETVYIDIKTTSREKFMGNMQKDAWSKFNAMTEKGENVIIVCFVIDKDQLGKDEEAVAAMGCYDLASMPSTGGNRAAGRLWTHVDQDEINPIEELPKVISSVVDN